MGGSYAALLLVSRTATSCLVPRSTKYETPVPHVPPRLATASSLTLTVPVNGLVHATTALCVASGSRNAAEPGIDAVHSEIATSTRFTPIAGTLGHPRLLSCHAEIPPEPNADENVGNSGYTPLRLRVAPSRKLHTGVPPR